MRVRVRTRAGARVRVRVRVRVRLRVRGDVDDIARENGAVALVVSHP